MAGNRAGSGKHGSTSSFAVAEVYWCRSGISISTRLCGVEGLHVPLARDGSDATTHPAYGCAANRRGGYVFAAAAVVDLALRAALED